MLRNLMLQLHPYPICTYLTRCNDDWKDTDIICDFSKLYYILEGEAHLIIDGVEYVPEPGELYLIPAGVRHSYFQNNKKPVLKYWTHFQTDHNGGLFLIHDKNAMKFTPDQAVILPLFQELATYHSYTRPMEIFKELALFYEILGICFEALLPERILPANQNSFTVLINPYMDANYQHPVSVSDLAALVNLQPNYFIQSFRKHYQETPINYLNNFRLEKSIRLLLDSDNNSIQEIAFRCGFSDYRYYSRLFKRRYGMSPGMYRKSFQ